MKLSVVATARLADDVLQIVLRHPRRPTLPAPEPGSHVDLHLPDGRVRQYSLCGDPDDHSSYTIAVRREHDGRGGSAWLHDHLVPGALVPVSAPRNHFPLATEARHHVLVAGGIGITPIAAIAQHLARRGGSFELHYCARDQAHAPLLERLGAVCGERLQAWFSQGPQPRRLDISRFEAAPPPGVHLYACGPARLLDALGTATSRWPRDAVHTERFEPLADGDFVPEPFEVQIASSGAVLDVPAGRSLLDVLREHGFMLPSSCGIGVCGTCECGFRIPGEGNVIHRDVVLAPGDRDRRLMPCVSRGRGRLVIDL